MGPRPTPLLNHKVLLHGDVFLKVVGPTPFGKVPVPKRADQSCLRSISPRCGAEKNETGFQTSKLEQKPAPTQPPFERCRCPNDLTKAVRGWVGLFLGVVSGWGDKLLQGQ